MTGFAAKGIATAFALGVLGGAGLAQGAPQTTLAPAIQAVADCRAVQHDSERLACFDRTVALMTAAEHAGDLVTIDREQRRAVRRQAFGLALPSLTLFDRGDKPEETDRLTVTIASASRNDGGKWLLRLDDGALWRQTDDSEIYPSPKAGAKAIIRKGALGSYFMSIDGKATMRVHRDS